MEEFDKCVAKLSRGEALSKQEEKIVKDILKTQSDGVLALLAKGENKGLGVIAARMLARRING